MKAAAQTPGYESDIGSIGMSLWYCSHNAASPWANWRVNPTTLRIIAIEIQLDQVHPAIAVMTSMLCGVTSPVITGALVGLDFPNKAPNPPNWKMKH